MIARAFFRSLEQVLDPRFRKVFILGVILALLVFAGLLAAMYSIRPDEVTLFGIDWIDEALSWLLGYSVLPVFIVTMWFLFPAVSTVMMGLFLDDIVDAVEAEHYPGFAASRPLGIAQGTYLALRMGAVVLLLNILALPLYFVLLFSGVGPFILFFLLNSYLIGREYYELVGARHMTRLDLTTNRRNNRSDVFLGGAVVMGLFLVPIANLLAPIIGAAMMTHIYHQNNTAGPNNAGPSA